MKITSAQQKIKNFEKKQYFASAITLFLLCGASVLLNTLHLESVAEETTRFLSRVVSMDDFREASIVLQEAHLSSFKTVRYQSSKPSRSFILPPKAEFEVQSGFWHSLSVDSVRVPVEIGLSSVSPDEIIFEFERFSLIPYALGIWLILNIISIPQTRFLKRKLFEKFEEDLQIEKKLAKNEIAREVRHNLRTPLAALMRIPNKLPDSVAGDRELLKTTINQIRSLISKLDDQKPESLSERFDQNIYRTLMQSSQELGLSFGKSVKIDFSIDDMISSAFVKHIPFEIRAIIGNLVTNAIEASDQDKSVAVNVQDLGHAIEITVTDHGRGIETENLEKIFEKDISIGKKNGSGIGLFHAKEQIESWGGRIEVSSILGSGSSFKVILPIAERAAWYTPRLKFNERSKVFVLDDQKSAHALWEMKFDEASLNLSTRFASSQDELKDLFANGFVPSSDATLLFDYDLGSTETGLELLNKIPLGPVKCLVTGHFDVPSIQEACVKNGIFLIPKTQIPELAMVFVES